MRHGELQAAEMGRAAFAGAAHVALSFDRVTHAFRRRVVVDDVSLDLRHGEIVCLLGPSGCGKTTLLRIAAGLEPLQRGRILLKGRVVAEPGREVPAERRGIGFVFQDYALFPHLDVLANVIFGLDGLAPAVRRERGLALLERVRMAGHAASFPHMLSGGEQQRVALARALAPEPDVILLDEPFSNLDVRLCEDVRAETLAILREAGASALMVTHDAEEAMFMADRMAVMRAGRLIQVDTPDAVYLRPATTFVTKFLGFVNAVHATVAGGRVASTFGEHRAPGLGDGTLVDVLVRPEGVRLAEPGGAVEATVVSRHRLGADSLIVLCLADGGGSVRARLARDDGPAVGCRVSLDIDPEAVFLFPCDAPGDRA